MRKIFAFILICVFSLLLKNEKAISNSNCATLSKKAIHPSTTGTEVIETATTGFKPYDGFFIKL